MRLNQIHTCWVGACLSYYGGGAIIKCKCCMPWLLSDVDNVDEKGNWKIQQTYGYVNNYNPDLLVALWCNQDIKLLMNREDTKHLMWYISNCATKGQKSVYNMSSLIVKYATYQFSNMEDVLDTWEHTCNLLFHCLHATNQEAEQSGPQVVSYLMGWGDRYLSHWFIALYWGGVKGHLMQWFPDLK